MLKPEEHSMKKEWFGLSWGTSGDFGIYRVLSELADHNGCF
jgi:hypothetical protein